MRPVGYGSYVLRRFLSFAVSSFAVLTFCFFLFRVLPGDPVTLLFRDPRLTPDQIQYLYAKFGLDKPLWQQYLVFLENVARGELGISFFYRRPVAEVLPARIINSLILVVPATLLSIVLGIATGVVASWKRGRPVDKAILFASLGLYSLPTFWLGGLLIILSIYFLHLPVSGMLNYGVSYASSLDYLRDLASHLALPLLTLTLVSYGGFTLTVRGAMMDILSEDFIRAAKAKGLPTRRILLGHALPNAMLPTVSLMAISLGSSVTGSVLTETIFNWPGVGRMIFDAVSNRDYPLLQAAFLVVTISVLLANFIADVVYGLLDPRIRYG
ncbi:MAG: ABC transporter permease [Desulfurococcaceae archaeon]